MVRKGARVAAAGVTNFRWGLVLAGVLGFCIPLMAAVLPEDRADALFHSYSGGGVTINGPSILARKQLGKKTSVWGNYYVDSITSASIDVITSASEYTEKRTEQSLGVDYLEDKTTLSMAYTSSVENDFDAKTLTLGSSMSMFGDLTTVTLGYSRGWDTVMRSTDDFEEKTGRQAYRFGLSQVLTKNTLLGFGLDVITDEGFLNNPYRSVSYLFLDPSDPTCDPLNSGCATERRAQAESYPNTHTTYAAAVRAIYYLPYRASIKGEYRIFTDTWGVNASNYELVYTHPIEPNWILDFKYRFYTQTHADFYSDMFPFQDAQNYLARDKELSSYSNQTFGIGASYEFGKGGWGVIDKGSVNLNYDYLTFQYKDFRDLTKTGYRPGEEPLYSFSANVVQFFVSVWY